MISTRFDRTENEDERKQPESIVDKIEQDNTSGTFIQLKRVTIYGEECVRIKNPTQKIKKYISLNL